MAEVFRRKYRGKDGKQHRCSTYTIRYYDGSGRRYEEPAKTTSKEDAEAIAREREQAVWEGRFFPGKQKPKDMTVDEMRKRWLDDKKRKRSLRHDRARLAVAVEYFKPHRLIATISTDDVAAFKKHLEQLTTKERNDEGELVDKPFEVSTVNRHLAALKSALRHVAKAGYRHQDPMRSVQLDEERNRRNRLPTDDEYARLRKAASPDLRLVITIGRRVGMRLAEIVEGANGRLDARAGVVRLDASETKEADIKTVPMHSEVIDELEKLPTPIDGRYFRYTANTYSRQFSALCAELGIENLHFHDLRHTALTNMADAGVDIITMAAISGHKTLAMLQRYVHRRPAALKAAMARVEDHAAGLERS